MKNLLIVSIQYYNMIHIVKSVHDLRELLNNYNFIDTSILFTNDKHYHKFIIDFNNMIYYKYEDKIINAIKFRKCKKIIISYDNINSYMPIIDYINKSILFNKIDLILK